MTAVAEAQKVPRVFIQRDLFSCARSEAGDLYLKIPCEALPEVLKALWRIRWAIRKLVEVTGWELCQMPVQLVTALAEAVKSCLIKNGELAESE